jgi:hypothetical protein
VPEELRNWIVELPPTVVPEAWKVKVEAVVEVVMIPSTSRLPSNSILPPTNKSSSPKEAEGVVVSPILM